MQAGLRVYKGDRALAVVINNQGSSLEELLAEDAKELVSRALTPKAVTTDFNVRSILIKGELTADVMWLRSGEWVVLYYNDVSLNFAKVFVFTKD